MKNIKFIKVHPAYAYFAGDEAKLPNEAAEELLKGKFAEEAEEEKPEPKEHKKPHKK